MILATDPDREGEAISWHVQEVLAKKQALPAHVERVTFNAITKSAVLEAMARPRALDEDLIDAYRARRALDYLVGFTLSPVLWRKLPGAKSAGRVQSVALRLIVDREREIELFRAQEYWSVTALMEADGTEFSARLVRYNGEKIDRLTIGEEGTALAAKRAVEEGRFARRLGRDQAADPQSAAALHHLDPAAGGGAQARLLGEPDDAGGAEPLRGRVDHLHAHRRRADGARGDLGRAPGGRRPATTPATCPTSRAITRPRPRTRRKRTRRSGRPISPATAPARAIMAGSTS